MSSKSDPVRFHMGLRDIGLEMTRGAVDAAERILLANPSVLWNGQLGTPFSTEKFTNRRQLSDALNERAWTVLLFKGIDNDCARMAQLLMVWMIATYKGEGTYVASNVVLRALKWFDLSKSMCAKVQDRVPPA